MILIAAVVGTIQAFFGTKQLSEDWHPPDLYAAGGVATIGVDRPPIQGVLLYERAWREREYEIGKIYNTTTEIGAGLRFVAKVSDFHRPFIELGVVQIDAKSSAFGGSSSTKATGPWLGVGLLVKTTGPGAVGVHIRYSSASKRDVDLGGLHAALTFAVVAE